jgi:hypothetical protein
MTKGRVIAGIVFILLLLGFWYQISLNRQVGTEQDQITALVLRGESGVERKKASEAMSIVSKDYKDNIGMTYGMMRIRVADALNSAENPDVTLTNPVIQVNGDQATMSFHARVADRRNDSILFDHNLTINLRKEKLHKYLIFTTHEWRVTSTQGLEGVLEGM